MGCSASKQAVTDDSAVMRRRGPRASMVAGFKTETVKGPAAEAPRLVTSNSSLPLDLPAAGYSLRYAFFSQRGYYPDAPDKANQDVVCVAERLGGSAGGRRLARCAGGAAVTLHSLPGVLGGSGRHAL